MAGQRILVVDDEPSIVRTLSYVLRRDGFEVLEAHDGAEAVEVARREKPDLVFLDVMMPRMSGFDAITEIKGTPELASTHVVVLPAKGQAADRDVGFKLGCDEYLTKPFSTAKIVELARSVLGPASRA